MLNGESHWKIEQYFFWPFLILAVVIAIAGVVIALVARDRQNDFDREETNWFVAIWSACWVIIIGLMLIGQYPFSANFHKWYGVEGTVSETSSRLLTDSDGNVSQKIVIRFAESNTLYGCNDTRCALAHKGDHIRLLCSRDFEFNAVPGWNCKYDQVG